MLFVWEDFCLKFTCACDIHHMFLLPCQVIERLNCSCQT